MNRLCPLSIFIKDKKAQLSLTNPRDAKACQNCSNSTCLQRCRWQYWPIFMRLTAIASEIRENPEKFAEKSNLWSSRSSKVIDIGVNRKPICVLLLVINSNFSRICYRFRDIHGITVKNRQESCAIAKMTARCALYK